MRIFLFLFLGLLIFQCTRVDDPLSSNFDREINIKIQGKWTNDGNQILIINNDNFIDSLFISNKQDDSLVLYRVLAGKFKINNGVISFINFSIQYFNTSLDTNKIAGFRIVDIWPVFINDSLLKCQSVEVFNNLDKNEDKLWGKWQKKSWLAIKDYSNEIEYSGNEIFYYEYIKSTKMNAFDTLIYGFDYDFENPWPIMSPRKTTFIYSFNDSNNIQIKFASNKMYWYHPNEYFLKKID